MPALLEAGEIKRLQERRRRSLIVFTTSVLLAALGCALRFVPRWNDRLSGGPGYAKAMTMLSAQELFRRGLPVIVLGENDRCDALQPARIRPDEIVSSLYVLTWSEREHFSCITLYSIPAQPTKFANLLTIRPEDGWIPGPKLRRPIQALPIMRQVHVFSPQYLQLLHWRTQQPRLPLTEDEAARLAARNYASTSDPSLFSPSPAPSQDASEIELDFNQARALVREPHDRMNFRLSVLLTVLAFLSLGSALALFLLRRKAAPYDWLCAPVLTMRSFLFRDLYALETAARNRHREQQQELARQKQQEESLHLRRQELEFHLRSALESLHDAALRQRIEECLTVESADVVRLAQLWDEVVKESAHKTPEERLAALLESLKPYCTEEELESCRQETLSLLEKSGFRLARQNVVARHEEFRQRAKAKELEASESQDNPLVE